MSYATPPESTESEDAPCKLPLSGRVAGFFWHRKRLSVLLLVFLVFFVVHALSMFTYSDGSRSGYIRKFSREKGFVFRTSEGELDQRIGGGGMYHPEDIFTFTAVHEDVVKDALEKAERSGKRLTLHYRQRLFHVFWRGDTVYFVDKVDLQD